MTDESDQDIRRILNLAQNICRPHGITANEVVEQDDGYGIIIQVPHDRGIPDSQWQKTINTVRDELQKLAGVKGVLLEIEAGK